MKTVFIAALGAASLAATASADFIGWTSNVRSVSGGYLVNVFAVVDNSTDVLLNVAGGSPGLPTAGYVRTNSTGGFLQGTGTQSVFAPSGSQSWTTLDSFLTVGGGYSTTTGNFTGNGATAGDPPWNVTYTDTDVGESVTVNAFNTQSNETGFTNRYTNNVPATGGWFIAGSSSPARNLSVLANRLYSSSAAAAAGNAGMMVAQLYVADLSLAGSREFGKVIEWKMSATVRRLDGSTSNQSFQFVIGEVVPAPGALAILGLAGLAARRRRA
jgi:MYXO-CTERM domain-containing protein